MAPGPTRKLSTSGDSLYQLLGIEKNCAPEDIKKQYRKMALKYHPDKNPDDPQAADKFKEVNRANRVLSDESQRKIYDSYGSVGIQLAETIDPKHMKAYLFVHSRWFKSLLLCCTLLTGCCCCCCLCCCFNFCCGKCKPEGLDEDEEAADPDAVPITDQPKAQDGSSAEVATDAPAEANGAPPSPKAVFAMPPPPAKDTTEVEAPAS